LIPTRTGKACVAVSPDSLCAGHYLEVWPSRREESWIFVNIPSLEKRTPQVWVPGSALWSEGPGASSNAHLPEPPTDQEAANPRTGERAHQRVAAPSIVFASESATIRDLSLGGISLDQESPRAVGERARIGLVDIFQNETCELEAEVVWCRHGRLGLRWVGLSQSQHDWLRQRLGEPPQDSAGPQRKGGDRSPETASGIRGARMTLAFQPPASLISSLY
jgi:hypothetical protein